MDAPSSVTFRAIVPARLRRGWARGRRRGLQLADVFSKAKRSEIMSRVRSHGNQLTERRLVQILRRFRISGWRRQYPIVGSPDFVFRDARVAVFVDGCFWHCCPMHGEMPRTNRQFWAAKLYRNRMRDRAMCKRLKEGGWRVVRLWQHELNDAGRIAARLRNVVGARSDHPGPLARRQPRR